LSNLRIIVVEDHQDLREVFVNHLNGEGFDVIGVSCGEEMDDCLSDGNFDLLILDVNLPGENGFEIAQRMRAAHRDLHILIITARTAEDDRIRGYDSGADLYLPKPVSAAELTAAVRSVQRRLGAMNGARSELVLDTSRMCLTNHRGEVRLSKSDVALLKAMAIAPDRRLPYWRLFEVTERDQNDAAKGQLELQVFRLRRKLAEIGIEDDLIKAVRREGYLLTQPIGVVH